MKEGKRKELKKRRNDQAKHPEKQCNTSILNKGKLS